MIYILLKEWFANNNKAGFTLFPCLKYSDDLGTMYKIVYKSHRWRHINLTFLSLMNLHICII